MLFFKGGKNRVIFSLSFLIHIYISYFSQYFNYHYKRRINTKITLPFPKVLDLFPVAVVVIDCVVVDYFMCNSTQMVNRRCQYAVLPLIVVAIIILKKNVLLYTALGVYIFENKFYIK